jgi:esterase
MILNHKIIGEGFPVIILHGLFGMLDNWQSIGKLLADKGFMVHLIDQRDHGKSPHTTAFNYDVLADDILQYMEEQSLSKAHIIGHSMGGKTSMHFAILHPEYVEQLFIVDICNKVYKDGHSEIFKALLSIDVKALDTRNEVYQHLSSFGFDEGTIQFLLKNLSRNIDAGFHWKMNVPLLYKDYENILVQVGNNLAYDQPTTFIRGENSNYISENDWSNMQEQFTKSSLVTIPNAGHWVHADQPQLLLDCLVGVLGVD